MNRMFHALGLFALLGCSLAATPALAQDGTAGCELRVATLDGPVFDLSAKRGQWVVVNYWATLLQPVPEGNAGSALRRVAVMTWR